MAAIFSQNVHFCDDCIHLSTVGLTVTYVFKTDGTLRAAKLYRDCVSDTERD
jgi:hypothetical protein